MPNCRPHMHAAVRVLTKQQEAHCARHLRPLSIELTVDGLAAGCGSPLAGVGADVAHGTVWGRTWGRRL